METPSNPAVGGNAQHGNSCKFEIIIRGYTVATGKDGWSCPILCGAVKMLHHPAIRPHQQFNICLVQNRVLINHNSISTTNGCIRISLKHFQSQRTIPTEQQKNPLNQGVSIFSLPFGSRLIKARKVVSGYQRATFRPLFAPIVKLVKMLTSIHNSELLKRSA